MTNINERDGFQSSFYNDESSFYNAGGDPIKNIASMVAKSEGRKSGGGQSNTTRGFGKIVW